VPVSIVRKDLIPKMQAEPDCLTKNHIRMHDAKNNEQPPLHPAWATPDGVVQFRDDIYNRDGFGSQVNAVKG
jgi:murein L,D-transpeptidase YcbB/YkuD